MNKTALFTAFILWATLISAQYRRIPLDIGYYWQQTAAIKTLAGPVANCWYYIRVSATVVIAGNQYSAVGSEKLSCDTYVPAFYQSALLREDTNGKKVIALFKNKEYVLYNFNKSPGDTVLMLDVIAGPITATVSACDSVLCNDGLYHKRFTFANPVIYPVIEGIGSLGGLLTPGRHFEQAYALKCFGRSSPPLSIYSSAGAGSTCPLTTGLAQHLPVSRDLIIYPNPANENVIIEGSDITCHSLSIINAIGQTLIKVEKPAFGRLEIDVAALPQGIYFLVAEDDDRILCRRFAKE